MIDHAFTAAQLPGYLRFVKALNNPEKAQTQRLSEILKNLSGTSFARTHGLAKVKDYASFAKKIPVTDYLFWEKDILSQRQQGGDILCSKTERYQPTSGSSSAQKWIPYSKGFMTEMDSALQAWLGDLGLRHRPTFRGAQYWSLSWLPQVQRAQRPSNDDLELLPGWKRWFLQKVMAVPSAVTYTSSMEESQFATLAFLASRQDLSLVSVWSPTFWLTLMDLLPGWQKPLAATLRTGRWALPQAKIDIRAPYNPWAADVLENYAGHELFRKLWPQLALISCWDSAASAPWAQKIRQDFPQVQVQGKGLWATEGVITIPFRNKFPAALTSHFLEWIDLDTNKVLPTWELQVGQMVQPLLSGSHGLLRYKLNDSLKVTGKVGMCPSFEFCGRLLETDLVGEKMSQEMARDTFAKIEQQTGARLMSMFAVKTKNSKPYYLVLAQDKSEVSAQLEEAIEKSLSRVFHYKLARELGQLNPVRVRLEKHPEVFYQQLLEKKGMLAGNIKVEPLVEISEDLLN